MYDISVLIPARDEANALPALLTEIAHVLAHHQGCWEVLVVNDGSCDDSARVLARLSQDYAWLRVIEHRQSRGQSMALLSGAHQAHQPILVLLDGDGQNDPADIPRLLAALTTNMALVGGIRQHRQDSAWRRFTSWLANRIRRALLHDDCLDSGCGMRVIRQEVFLSLPRFRGMHRFLPALCRQQGWATGYVPVNHRPRRGGHSKYTTLHRARVGLVDLLGVWWLGWRGLPADPKEPPP